MNIFILNVYFELLYFFKQYLDRRRQRNGKRQEESNNVLIEIQEPISFMKGVLTTMT